MERTTHYEETTTTRVGQQGVVDTHVHDTHGKGKKNKKNKHAKDTTYGPKKSVGTKIKEFFTGHHDDGIIYQNGLPIAGLNGPIVQPMGAPIRQPAEIHPVATVNTTQMNVGHVPGDHFQGPTTTTYGPAPPIAPGMPEGYSKTTTTTEVVRPGIDYVQSMNAVAQPTGLGAIAQPAGVIIAGKDKRAMGLKEGYLKDQKVHAYPHAKVSKQHDTHDSHHHDDVYTNTTGSYIEQPVMPVTAVPANPAPAIFTGPAHVIADKHGRAAHGGELTEKELKKEQKMHDKEMKREQKLHDKEMKHHHNTADQGNLGSTGYSQPTHLEQPGYIAPTGYAQQPLIHETGHHHNLAGNNTVVQEQSYILQQPGMAPTNQPLVRNHQQVPMNSQSGLAQGGLYQNDTAQPVQTFTPIVQQNQPLTDAPILNQAAMEQNSFVPAGIRTKEGFVETVPKMSAGKHTTPYPGGYPGYEERKETVVHKDVKY